MNLITHICAGAHFLYSLKINSLKQQISLLRLWAIWLMNVCRCRRQLRRSALQLDTRAAANRVFDRWTSVFGESLRASSLQQRPEFVQQMEVKSESCVYVAVKSYEPSCLVHSPQWMGDSQIMCTCKHINKGVYEIDTRNDGASSELSGLCLEHTFKQVRHTLMIQKTFFCLRTHSQLFYGFSIIKVLFYVSIYQSSFQSIIYVSKLKMSSKTYKIILYVIKFLNYLINQIIQKIFKNLKLKKSIRSLMQNLKIESEDYY